MHTVPDLRFSILTSDGWRKLDAFERIVLKGSYIAFKGDLFSVAYPFGSIVLVLPDPDGVSVWVRLKYAGQQNISETLVPFRNRRRTDRIYNTGRRLDSLTSACNKHPNPDCRSCPWTAQPIQSGRPPVRKMGNALLATDRACRGCHKAQPLSCHDS